jgi:sulfatase maturation enzyme AslB (radical SAM superfamily)
VPHLRKGSYEQLSKILKKIDEQTQGFGVKILFAHGEPFTEFETMKRLVEETSDKFTFSSLSNGTLLDSEKLAWLRVHKDRVKIFISLDGNEKIKSRVRNDGKTIYDLIDVKKMFQENQDILSRITCTISPYNIRNLYEHILYMVDDLCVKSIHFTICVDKSWSDEDLVIADEQIKKMHQEFINRYNTDKRFDLWDKKNHFTDPFVPGIKVVPPCELFIDADGEVYFCCTTSLLKDADYTFGNIFKDNLNLEEICQRTRKHCKMILTKYLCPGVVSFGGIPKELDKNAMKFIGLWEKWRKNTSYLFNIGESNDR